MTCSSHVERASTTRGVGVNQYLIYIKFNLNVVIHISSSYLDLIGGEAPARRTWSGRRQGGSGRWRTRTPRVALPPAWKREFKLPWREADLTNHHDDQVDSDQ
jgi:hypothetical protein